TEFVELSWTKIFNQCVALGKKPEHNRHCLWMLQIERDGTLIAAVQRPPERVTLDLLPPLADRIASRGFYLDHIGAKIGKQARTVWSRNEMPDFENAKIRQQSWSDVGHCTYPYRLNFSLRLLPRRSCWARDCGAGTSHPLRIPRRLEELGDRPSDHP